MMKHAYLILAHNAPDQLQRLVTALDDERNDIYVHWDANSGPLPVVVTGSSSLRFVEHRVPVYWADYSMVEAEMALFEAAYDPKMYSYYHLISGADVPVKSQDYIHDYCESHSGTEFIGFSVPGKDEIHWRTQHYFLFPSSFRNPSFVRKVLRAAYVKLQDIVGYRRHDTIVRKGPQWFSATGDFIGYILDHRAWTKRLFNHTFAPDELFVQTLCWNSQFRDRLYDISEEFRGCKRFIKWRDGELIPLSPDDVDDMVSSEMWFARKVPVDGGDFFETVEIRLNEQDISNSTGL